MYSFWERTLLPSKQLWFKAYPQIVKSFFVQDRKDLSVFCWVILKHGLPQRLQKDVWVPWVSISKRAGRQKVFSGIHWVLAMSKCLSHSRNCFPGRQFVRDRQKQEGTEVSGTWSSALEPFLGTVPSTRKCCFCRSCPHTSRLLLQAKNLFIRLFNCSGVLNF